ncbi:MAG: fructosamine kinase family protein [Chloroflexota bacterium]
MNIQHTIETAVRHLTTTDHVVDIETLSGGCVGQVYQVELSNGDVVVAKLDERKTPHLLTESYMLHYLKTHSALPVPDVLYATDRILLLEFVAGHSVFSRPAEQHAAELLAALHQQTAPAFGLERETLIGGLIQPNDWSETWIDFFREQRLFYMAREGEREGRLPTAVLQRLERFCNQLEQLIDEPERPSLIHGDVWTTNVLAENGRITAFLDPAIYYAHPEIELAFTTLFGTFDHAFFTHYNERNPISPGFFETRRDIYNLYPLLVHVRLFGGGYVPAVDQILRRFGC